MKRILAILAIFLVSLTFQAQAQRNAMPRYKTYAREALPYGDVNAWQDRWRSVWNDSLMHGSTYVHWLPGDSVVVKAGARSRFSYSKIDSLLAFTVYPGQRPVMAYLDVDTLAGAVRATGDWTHPAGTHITAAYIDPDTIAGAVFGSGDWTHPAGTRITASYVDPDTLNGSLFIPGSPTWTIGTGLTISGTIANLGTVTTATINGGTWSGTTATATTSFLLGDDDFIGLSGSAARIIFDDATTDLTILTGADVLVKSTVQSDRGGAVGIVVDPAVEGALELVALGANAAAANLEFVKTRNSAANTHTIVNADDVVARINVFASDGSNYDRLGALDFAVDGTPGNGTDMPGRMSLFLTPDGSATSVERFRVSNDGNVTIDVDGTFAAGDHDLEIQNGASFSEVDAGEANFTIVSSESMKEGFAAVDTAAVLAAFGDLRVQRWRYKRSTILNAEAIDKAFADTLTAGNAGEKAERKARAEAFRGREYARAEAFAAKPRVSVMAEDFYHVGKAMIPSLSDSTKLSGDHMQAATIFVVQDLLRRVAALETP